MMKGNSTATSPLMGTLAWCESSAGRLKESEKITFARNVASLQAEIVFDEFRNRLGLLRPPAIDLETLAPPDSKLVRDADALAREIYDDLLWNHSMRTYYFGSLIAAFDGIKFDRELFYAAAICHDVGVNQDKAGSIASCCFAHSGGKLTHDRLLADGHSSETVLHVGDAISTHMNLYIPVSEYPAESTLVAVGATCDVMGAYVRRIEIKTLDKVVSRWPRTGLIEDFGAFLTSKQHMKDTRTAVAGELGIFEGDGPHPIETILSTL